MHSTGPGLARPRLVRPADRNEPLSPITFQTTKMEFGWGSPAHLTTSTATDGGILFKLSLTSTARWKGVRRHGHHSKSSAEESWNLLQNAKRQISQHITANTKTAKQEITDLRLGTLRPSSGTNRRRLSSNHDGIGFGFLQVQAKLEVKGKLRGAVATQRCESNTGATNDETHQPDEKESCLHRRIRRFDDESLGSSSWWGQTG